MANENLSELLSQLERVQARANTDLEAVPWQTKASMANAKREAEDQLPKLRDAYVRKVRSNTLGMYVFGDPKSVERFCAIAAEEGLASLDAERVYARFAARIMPTIGTSREFGPTQLGGLIRVLDDFAKETGLRFRGTPSIKDIVTIASTEECVAYIKRLLHETFDDEMVRVVLDRELSDAAIAKKHVQGIFAATVKGCSNREMASTASLFTNALPIEVGAVEEVNKEYVLDKLQAVREQLLALRRSSTTN